MLAMLLVESISHSKSLLVVVCFSILTNTQILLFFWQLQVPTVKGCKQMLEQMGDVAMEEYGERLLL